MKATKPRTSDLTVRLSTNGQLVLPKEIRDRHGWSAGAELVFEDHADRVVLRQVADLPPTRVEDLIGCTGYRGPTKSLKEMEQGGGEAERFATFDRELAESAMAERTSDLPAVDWLGNTRS